MIASFKKKSASEKVIRKGIKLISLGITSRLRKVVEEGEKLSSYNIGISRVDIYEYEGRGYYIINEPSLTQEEISAYYRIMDELYFSLKPIVEVDPSKVIDEVFKVIGKVYKNIDINKIKYYVIRDTLGYGPLDVVMNDPKIEDISGEGVNRPIRVFHRDFSYLDWLITNIIFETEEDADRIALLLAHKARRHVSTAFPIAEGTLPEKHRIVITYGFEVTPFGSGFTVRKFREEPLSIAHLIKFGTISPLMAAYWWIIFENKGSAFIVGEMASGKSVHPKSVIMALIDGVPRILTIEELWNLVQEKVKMINKVNEMEYIDLEGLDIKVLALNGLNISWYKPRYIIRHKAPEKLVKIKLYSGRKIILTEDHSLLAFKPNGSIEVIKPQNLSKEMYLLGIKRLRLPTIDKHLLLQEIIESLGKQGLMFKIKGLKKKIAYREILKILNSDAVKISDIYVTSINTKTQVPLEALFKPEFGYLLGLFVSKGYDDGQEVHLYIEFQSKELKSKLKNITNSLKLKYNEYKLKTCLRVSFPPVISKVIRAFNCGKKACNKRIPSIAWIMDYKWIIHLIAGIIDGDGYVSERGIEVTTSSENLAYDMMYAFTILGIYPTLRVKVNNETKKKYHTIYVSTYWIDELKELLHILLTTKRSKLLKGVKERAIFHSEIDIIPKESLYVLSKKAPREIQMYLRDLYYSNENASRKNLMKYYNILPKEIKELVNSDLIFEKIKEIEIVENDNKYVYDIEVPGIENFEVNTIFVHNTTLMNALLSLLPPNAKIVTIEDTPELRLPHIGWKPLVARHTYTLTGSKVTEVSLFDLVKLALRERATVIAIGEIRGEEAYVFIQAIASGHGGVCLKHGEPIIIKENGIVRIVPIGKLVDNILSNGKKIGDIKVLTFNPMKGLEWKHLKRVYRVEGLKTWVKIKTVEGRICEVTSDHIIPVVENNKVKFKKAIEIRKGDTILLASKLPMEPKYNTLNAIECLEEDEDKLYVDGRTTIKELVKAYGIRNVAKLLRVPEHSIKDWAIRSYMPYIIFKKLNDANNKIMVKYGAKGRNAIPSILELNRDLGLIIGLYLAEGTVSGVKVVYNLGKDEEKLAKRVKENLERIFSLKPKIKRDKSAIIVYVNSKILAKLFKKLFGSRAEDKDIPDFLLNTPKGFRAGIIEGYWLGDGHIRRHGSKTYMAVAETASKSLAYKVHYLLKTLEIDSSVRSIKRTSTNKLYKRPHYIIRIHGGKSLSNFISIFDLEKPRTGLTKAELLSGSKTKPPDTLLDVVTEAEIYSSTDPAYDIEIEGNHTFVHGCSMITHNCTFHGDSLESMVMRLTTPPINVPISFLPLVSNVIITRYIRIPGEKPMRRVVKVYEITGLKSASELEYKVIFEWNILEDKHYPDTPEEVVKKSEKLQRVAMLLGWTEDLLLEELERRRKLLEKLVEENKLSYNEVTLAIQNYYKEVWKPLQ